MAVGVHVIGPGYGESIVVEFPDRTVGVIDCYHHPEARSFPVYDFLTCNSKQLRTKPLRFLAVTHPHADHCLGVMSLLREFKPDQFLVFRSILEEEYRVFLKLLKDRGIPDAVEASLRVPPGTIADEIYQIYDHIVSLARRWKPGHPKPKWLCPNGSHGFTSGSLPIRLRFLSPGTVSQSVYADQVHRAVRSAPPPGTPIVHDWSPGHTKPNLASGCIALEFDRTRLMFMADAERSLWDEWLDDSKADLDLRVTNAAFLKIAHHGSENGFHSEAFQQACTGRTVGVITPFTKQKDQPLPSRAGLTLLRPHFREIFCTNRFAAARSSGASWDPVPNERVAVPPEWLSLCAENSALIGLLSPAVGGPTTPSKLELPRAWRRACLHRPELLHALHPELPECLAILGKLPAHEEFRVSLFFDERGAELESRRFIGRGAGRLSS